MLGIWINRRAAQSVPRAQQCPELQGHQKPTGLSLEISPGEGSFFSLPPGKLQPVTMSLLMLMSEQALSQGLVLGCPALEEVWNEVLGAAVVPAPS